MKKILILLLFVLTPTLVLARIPKEEIVGNWELISKQHYLLMVFNRKGFVKITEGNKKHKPHALPLGIWSTIDGELKITINGKTKFVYRHIKFKGKKITVRNSHGKIEHFQYTPLNE